VVLGSDILYESKHPREVARGMLNFVRPGGRIILSDPGRAYLQKFLDAMRELGHEEEMSAVRVGEKEVLVFCYEIN
jgi:predicted nicotinamide N-methyase